MYFISRGLLLIICLGITVECQGGRGGGGRGGKDSYNNKAFN